MFWADKVAQELKNRKLPLEWVDDMKTPSGKIHVGALRGVVIHDLVFKALRDVKIKAKYTYVFDNHDPMDDLPVYLDAEKFSQYLGMPLYKVPSPFEGFSNYAEYYAKDFISVFEAIGCHPEILWATNLYMSGRMNPLIKEALDNANIIRGIYEEMYKKELPKDWYPFQVYCPSCGKVSTTKVYGWDGEEVTYSCNIDQVKYTKGCGSTGRASPFSSKKGITGKLPWKVEWSAKWQAIGVTVEGAGKDHMSRGGSHDLTSQIAKKVFKYPVPYPIPYEFFLVGGRKMSSSKGRGSSASDMLEILPPELLRFIMVKTKINQAINFDPAGETIPKLFDEYQTAANAYYEKTDEDLARTFELSQIGAIKKTPTVRFSILAQWVQMPNMQEEIKKQSLEEWAKYAKIWVEKYAPDSEKFLVQETMPEAAKNLSKIQKQYLRKIASMLDQKWSGEDFQKELYELSKEMNIPTKEAFGAIYLALIGKDHGPKAGWLILSLDKEFVKKRLDETATLEISDKQQESQLPKLNKPELFSISKDIKQKFPTVSVGIAIIKGVSIEKSSDKLEKEKEKLLKSLEALTTEELGQYPEIVSYRKLYKEMGIDWHSRRPSPEALLRRVALKKGLYNINTCVDAYNLVVMKHRVSVGAFDLDMIKFPTVLRLAKSGEEILLLGDQEPTKYKEGEIAYFDKIGGYNIDFNFRDSQRTAVTLKTKNLYINVDGVYNISPEQVGEVLEESCNMIIKYCGGAIETFGVDAV